MKSCTPHRVARLLAMVALLGGLTSCEDDPTGVEFGVELVEPLDIDWNGRETGVPFRITNTATVSARANIRVNWRVVISNQDGARWVQDDDVRQEQLLFSWKPPTAPRYPRDPNIFAPGDTCTAIATTDPAPRDSETEKTIFVLVIEGNSGLNSEDAPPNAETLPAAISAEEPLDP